MADVIRFGPSIACKRSTLVLACTIAGVMLIGIGMFGGMDEPHLTKAKTASLHEISSADTTAKAPAVRSILSQTLKEESIERIQRGTGDEEGTILNQDNVPPCDADIPDLLRPTYQGSMELNDQLQKKMDYNHKSLGKHWADIRGGLSAVVKHHQYCVAQCGLGRCCAGKGVRTGDEWLITVKDDIPTYEEDSGMDDVTLVTQATTDRIEAFSMINNAWPGPKVALFAIYNHTEEVYDSARAQLEELREVAKRWSNVKVLVVLLTWADDYYSLKFTETSFPILPINTFRNIVVDHSRTNFIFTVDMDFVPSSTLYPKLLKYYLPQMSVMDRVVMVIPHWETIQCNGEVKLVPDFEKLDSYSRQGIVRPFHVDIQKLIPTAWSFPSNNQPGDCRFKSSATWTPGIKTTNYFKWFRESHWGLDGFYHIPVMGPLHDKYYEPFLVVKRVELNNFTLPRYYEKYVGRYKNKISFVTTLRSYHYRFYGLRQEFLMHMPHPTSNSSDPAMKNHLLNMRKLNREDRDDLQEVYLDKDHDLIPEVEPSPFDDGVICRMD